MASGSTGRSSNPGTKGFNFGSDDILCSYEDYGHQDGTGHSEPVTGNNSTKEFQKSGMSRTPPFNSASYSPPEESSLNQDLVVTVERTMKKYTDNIMRFLEGISSRMSQLELYCYNLDKTIGEMRSELVHDHGEADSKLKSLDKHVQEVHRSVQILRDKQELADTQKELSKLHVQKESSSANNSHQNQDRPTSENKSFDTSPDTQLALALPNQVRPPAPAPVPVPSRPIEQQQQQQPHIVPASPMPTYYLSQAQPSNVLSSAQPSNVLSPAQPSQGQYLSSESQFRASQMPPHSAAQPQLNQSSQIQLLSPYQPQWTQQQQLAQQVQQAQVRPSSSPVYSSYVANQPNPTQEGVPNNMPIQIQFSGMGQSSGMRLEPVPYGYNTSGRPVQPQPQPQPQHLKPSYASGGDIYVSNGPHPNAYVIYDEGGRGSHSHFTQSGYPPSSLPNPNTQLSPGPNVLRPPPPPPSRNNPYGELIEKLLSMGYRGDHVVGAIQRLEESGQPVDFNAVLDVLNGHVSSGGGGGSQRGWSG